MSTKTVGMKNGAFPDASLTGSRTATFHLLAQSLEESPKVQVEPLKVERMGRPLASKVA